MEQFVWRRHTFLVSDSEHVLTASSEGSWKEGWGSSWTNVCYIYPDGRIFISQRLESCESHLSEHS